MASAAPEADTIGYDGNEIVPEEGNPFPGWEEPAAVPVDGSGEPMPPPAVAHPSPVGHSVGEDDMTKVMAGSAELQGKKEMKEKAERKARDETWTYSEVRDKKKLKERAAKADKNADSENKHKEKKEKQEAEKRTKLENKLSENKREKAQKMDEREEVKEKKAAEDRADNERKMKHRMTTARELKGKKLEAEERDQKKKRRTERHLKEHKERESKDVASTELKVKNIEYTNRESKYKAQKLKVQKTAVKKSKEAEAKENENSENEHDERQKKANDKLSAATESSTKAAKHAEQAIDDNIKQVEHREARSKAEAKEDEIQDKAAKKEKYEKAKAWMAKKAWQYDSGDLKDAVSNSTSPKGTCVDSDKHYCKTAKKLYQCTQFTRPLNSTHAQEPFWKLCPEQCDMCFGATQEWRRHSLSQPYGYPEAPTEHCKSYCAIHKRTKGEKGCKYSSCKGCPLCATVCFDKSSQCETIMNQVRCGGKINVKKKDGTEEVMKVRTLCPKACGSCGRKPSFKKVVVEPPIPTSPTTEGVGSGSTPPAVLLDFSKKRAKKEKLKLKKEKHAAEKNGESKAQADRNYIGARLKDQIRHFSETASIAAAAAAAAEQHESNCDSMLADHPHLDCHKFTLVKENCKRYAELATAASHMDKTEGYEQEKVDHDEEKAHQVTRTLDEEDAPDQDEADEAQEVASAGDRTKKRIAKWMASIHATAESDDVAGESGKLCKQDAHDAGISLKDIHDYL